MSMLDRKLLRDLLKMKAQAVAIALVMSCGIAIFTLTLSTLHTLTQAQQTYYDRARFADVFAQVKRAPRALEDRIAEIPGVAAVQTRVVRDVNLDVPGLREPAVGRLISIPDTRDPELNLLYLRRGRLPEPGRADEAVVGEAFAEAHGLVPGDRVRAILNGRLQSLTVVGVVLSPEYIYQIRPGDIVPDNRRFGVFWMRYEALAEAFDMKGAFNDVALRLLPGASEQAVIDRLDALLDRYGGAGAYGRADQTSHEFITQELDQLAVMAVLPPSIFLGVSAFLVNMVLGRIVRTQREQIAALKAFGYTNLQVGLHYLKLVLILAAAGSALGVFLGWWLGQGLTALYANFFRFPVFGFALEPRVVAGGVLLTAGLGSLGAWGAVRAAASLPPAEAMRPEPPPEYRPTIAERLGLQRYFSPAARMVLRKLESHPFRAALSSFGIALGVAVVILGNFSSDAVDVMIDFQFFQAQRQDMTVTFVEPTSRQAAFEAAQLPGVLNAEVFRAVPARLIAGPRWRRLAILGLEQDPTLNRVLDTAGRPVPLPESGLLLSESLARLLDVRPGDDITVEVLEGQRPTRTVRVADTVAGYVGLSAYMDIAALNRLMREDAAVSGAFLQADPAATDELYLTLKETPRVAGVTLKSAALQSFRETIAENILYIRAINAAFASIIAFGVVYNAARISLAERARELASMRILGFRRAEVASILLGELAVLVAFALPVGVLLGTGLAWSLIQALQSDLYTFPFVIDLSTYAWAVTLVLTASTVSALIVRHSINHLDLVGVLKNAS